ncbi:TRZ/ATZ family hydrolase [Beggiatoa leptomitoformis]|uniref:5-methylthioadenosine/S-adenosylhomocysteine deaminase n=1 Tax=Beggiatoa leptomitoformis TaxID=288004 RepID=A0A2N9YBI0_9GAMM|nr:TRZ/ATZ family hydrolase [Beggiatoa leptomitoformis]ALG66813.1 TRZ/ATZ family hydrolase [Beggiatoa leptomitoformis]AUI67838.1 TRZ/ATZ family hydrolase [Beggiatoa leptomitoformis]
MQSVDTLIYAGWVIPVEPEGVVYEQYAIAIDDGKIVEILPNEEATSRYLGRVTHRLATHVVIPGLINAHTHAAMTLLRGFADDLPLHEWLTTRIWPAERAFMSPEFVADGTRLAIAEMLRGGVTCFNDMYFLPEVAGDVVNEAGIRATLGLILLDFPTIQAQTPDEYLQKGHEVHAIYKNHHLIRTAIAPHAPYTVSDTPMQQGAEMADSLNIPIHIHVHETKDEVDQAFINHKERPLARLARLGVVSSRLVAVHATQLTDEEINLLAEHQATVVHCPESNMKLASGFCPVQKLLNAGVNVALGTDGTASNDDLDMLGEMRTAALLAKAVSHDARSVSAAQALTMATLNGAKALGIEEITGSLVVGKSADLVAINMSELETQPIYNALSHLVYTVSRDKVTDVWVAGRQLLKSRVLISLNVHDIQVKTHEWHEKIALFAQQME